MHTENLNFFAQHAEMLNVVAHGVQKPEYWDIFHVNAFELQSMEKPSEYLQKKNLQQNNHARLNIVQGIACAL